MIHWTKRDQTNLLKSSLATSLPTFPTLPLPLCAYRPQIFNDHILHQRKSAARMADFSHLNNLEPAKEVQASFKKKDFAQVKFMRDIYETAVCTFIWLGKEKDNYWMTMLIYHLNETRRKYIEAYETRKWCDIGFFKRRFSYRFPDFTSPAYWNYDVLLRRGWFTRLWIIQELAVSIL